MANMLRAWLSDAERVRQLSLGAGEIDVELSKNLVTTEILNSLLDLAEHVDPSGPYRDVTGKTTTARG
jgi:hypothetical protein